MLIQLSTSVKRSPLGLTNIRDHPRPESAHGCSKCQEGQEFCFHQRKSKSSSDSPSKAFMTNAANGIKTEAMTRISMNLLPLALNHNLQAFTKRCDDYRTPGLSRIAHFSPPEDSQSRFETTKLRTCDATRCARSTHPVMSRWRGSSAALPFYARQSVSTAVSPCLPSRQRRLLS